MTCSIDRESRILSHFSQEHYVIQHRPCTTPSPEVSIPQSLLHGLQVVLGKSEQWEAAMPPDGRECSAQQPGIAQRRGLVPSTHRVVSGGGSRPRPEPWFQVEASIVSEVMVGPDSYYLGRAMSKQKQWKKEK